MIYKGNNDLIGRKFGKLTVIEYAGNSKWKCRCDCGNEIITRTSSLNAGKTKSCGCIRGKVGPSTRNSKPKQDLTGQTFGYLTPIYYIKGGKWHCKYKCGNEVDVNTRNLNSGHTRSCGCLSYENNSKYVKDMTGFENENFKVLERDGSSPQGIAYWKCLCKHCGHIFSVKGSTIRSSKTTSCGCIHSRGETKIKDMLAEANINFIREYTFPDLVGTRGGKLRFDFAIFNNDKLSHLIEFNGVQHYEKPEGSWGRDWDNLLKNDNKKKEYCVKHNIPLIIIKYDQDFTISDLLLKPVETIS